MTALERAEEIAQRWRYGQFGGQEEMRDAIQVRIVCGREDACGQLVEPQLFYPLRPGRPALPDVDGAPDPDAIAPLRGRGVPHAQNAKL